MEDKCTDLVVTISKPTWIIRSVILYSDAFFKGGSHVVYPMQSTNQVVVPLRKDANSEELVEVKVLIGAGINAPHFLVHNEPYYKVTKFAFLMPLSTQ